MIQRNEAKRLLGFPQNSVPSPSQVKDAYRRKVWETHPDRFPPHLKPQAESNFKLISEAYTLLNSAGSTTIFHTAPYSRVVKSGVPRGGGGTRVASSLPFLLITLGALTLGGSTASRAYARQKEAHPSFNPFLP